MRKRIISIIALIVLAVSLLVSVQVLQAKGNRQKLYVSSVGIADNEGRLYMVATGPWNRCGWLTYDLSIHEDRIKIKTWQMMPDCDRVGIHHFELPIIVEDIRPGTYWVKINNKEAFKVTVVEEQP